MSLPSSDPIIHAPLLHRLLHTGEPITAHALAAALGLSTAAVTTELGRLRAAGCTFHEHPQHGLTLHSAGLSAWPDYLGWRFAGTPMASRRIEVYRQTGSTQEIARRLVAAHGRGADGALAIADDQTAGRGRLGRRWHAPAGKALAFTRVCCPEAAGEMSGLVDRLTFATAVGLAEAIERRLGGQRRVALKWPNDVYVDGRKLAGILVETVSLAGAGADAASAGGATGRAALIGVGLNTHLAAADLPADDAELRQRITSLAMLNADDHRLAILADVVAAIDTALDHTPDHELLDRWRARCTMLHHHVALKSDGRRIEGHVLDLDPQAGLIVRLDTGELVHLPAATTTVL